MTIREKQLEEALRQVMVWIDNWSPEFVYDSEWPQTRELVEKALEEKPLYIGLTRNE